VIPPVVSPTPLDTSAIDARREVVAAVSPPVVPRAKSPEVVARELPRPKAPPQSAPVVQAPAPKRATATAPSVPRTDVAAVTRAALPPSTPVIDSVPTRVTPPAVEKAPEPRARTEAANAPTSPTLIGTPPQPQYPEALRAQQVEGEVVVQFVVDENGQPDVSSMTVVRSPNVLLTNALRAVLPQFRYEPARTRPPQSAPRAETVRYAFTFRAPRR